MITLTETYTPDDLIQAARLHLRPRTALRWIGYILLFLAFVIWIIDVFFTNGSWSDWSRWALPAVGVYLIGLRSFIIPRAVRREFKLRKDLQRAHTFTIDESGVRFVSEGMDVTRPWSDFSKWRDNKQVLLLYISNQMYQVVLWRAFASDAERAAFKELVIGKVTQR